MMDSVSHTNAAARATRALCEIAGISERMIHWSLNVANVRGMVIDATLDARTDGAIYSELDRRPVNPRARKVAPVIRRPAVARDLAPLEWPFAYSDNVRSIRKQFPDTEAEHWKRLSWMTCHAVEWLEVL